MLKKPGLWEHLEKKAEQIKFGEMCVTVKIHEGLPIMLDVTSTVERFRDEKPKAGVVA